MKRFSWLMALLFLAATLLSLGAGGGGTHADALYLVTLYAPDASARTALVQRGIIPESIDLDAGTVTVVVDERTRARLAAEAWPILDVRPFDFLPADAAYHTYAEMVAELDTLAATYPHILHVDTYGRSVEGRPLYVVKISDNVTEDESATEAGALIFSNIHAREHLTLEQALWIIHHLVEGYGYDPSVTNLVNQREIWIMPNTNPDGTEYDIRKTGVYHWWRKNRRRNIDGSYGVDLNRNWGYRWGCCRGSSGFPPSETYRGLAPFSEPETRALRDFLLAHPSIGATLNFHSYSELVLWPYGYTDEALPADMDPTDYEVMSRAGRKMAAMSRYRPMQSSQLYRTDGTSDDWTYGVLRLPSWTVELYPTRNPPGFYPPASVIPEQTARNRGMVEYFIALADAPRKILGSAGDVVTPTLSLQVVPLRSTSLLTATITVSDNVGATLVAVQDEHEQTVSLRSIKNPQAGVMTYSLAFPLATGTHTLRAVAYDAAHNRGESPPITVEMPSEHALWQTRFPSMMKETPAP